MYVTGTVGREPRGLDRVADVHPLGERGERGLAVGEQHHLAVQQCVVDLLGQGDQLRVRRGDLDAGAGVQVLVAAADVGERADPVPLELRAPHDCSCVRKRVRPVRSFAILVRTGERSASCGRSGKERCRSAWCRSE
ncbi:hypothetical protein GCM10027452_32880 [Micromonospora halotolerans]